MNELNMILGIGFLLLTLILVCICSELYALRHTIQNRIPFIEEEDGKWDEDVKGYNK